MNLFAYNQPGFGPNVPGGFMGQAALNYAIGHGQMAGAVPSPMYFPNGNPIDTMRQQEMQLQLQSQMQVAAMNQAARSAEMLAGFAAMAGRQPTSDFMTGAQSVFNKGYQVGLPILSQFAGGRSVLDFMAGGLSQGNFLVPMQNLSAYVNDPVTGVLGGGSIYAGFHAQQFTDAMMQRPALRDGTPMGPRYNRGFGSDAVGATMAWMRRRAMLPGAESTIDYAISPAVRMAIDSGYMTPAEIAARSGRRTWREDAMIDAGYLDVEDVDGPLVSNAIRMREEGIVDRASLEEFQHSERALQSVDRRARQEAMASAKGVSDRISERYQSAFMGSPGPQNDLGELTEEQKTRRLLEIGFGVGGHVGHIRAETAAGLRQAREALANGDTAAYRNTPIGSMDLFSEQVKYVAAATGQSVEELSYYVQEMSLKDIRQMNQGVNADDPFGAVAGLELANAGPSDMTSTSRLVQGDYIQRMRNAASQQLGMMSAVSEIITDPDLKKNFAEILNIASKITSNSFHQLAGQDAELITRQLIHGANQIGLTGSELVQYADTAAGITQQAGVEIAFAPRTTRQMILAGQTAAATGYGNTQVFGQIGVDALQLEEGMNFNRSLTSRNGMLFGAMIRLHERAGRNGFDNSTQAGRILNAMVRGGEEGFATPEAQRFFAASESEKLQMLQEASGLGVGMIQSEIRNEFSNREALSRGQFAEALFKANSDSALESVFSERLAMSGDAFLRGQLGLKGEDYQHFRRALGQEIGNVVTSNSRSFITRIAPGSGESYQAAHQAVQGLLKRNDPRINRMIEQAGGVEAFTTQMAKGGIDAFQDNYESRYGKTFSDINQQMGEFSQDKKSRAAMQNSAAAQLGVLFSDKKNASLPMQFLSELADGELSGKSLLSTIASVYGADIAGMTEGAVNEARDSLLKAGRINKELQARGEAGTLDSDAQKRLYAEQQKHFQHVFDTLQGAVKNDDKLQEALRKREKELGFDDFDVEGKGKGDPKAKGMTIQGATFVLNGKTIATEVDGEVEYEDSGSREQVAR